jgi:AraC family transcriptional activator FtrA
MHAVVALALPAVEAFDLAIPAQVLADPGLPRRYEFTVCAPAAGLVRSTAGFSVQAEHGLAAAGLLDHRRATTHWQYAGQLAARYQAVKVDPDVLWVDEGAVLTSAGLAAGIDLCVQLVRADHGSEAAVSVARRMVVAPHRDGGQAQWLERPVPAPGEGLAATCQWALEHLADRLTVADLARHVGWAPRSLARRFAAETGMAPMHWLTAARIREARRLLEATDLPVEVIAARCGLGTAANLRLHLTRDAGAAVHPEPEPVHRHLHRLPGRPGGDPRGQARRGPRAAQHRRPHHPGRHPRHRLRRLPGRQQGRRTSTSPGTSTTSAPAW